MKVYYGDIYELLPDVDVDWFDENGVPRYCERHPKHCDIYAQEVVFLQVKCQSCNSNFIVAMSSCEHSERPLKDKIRNKTIHYGDPLT